MSPSFCIGHSSKNAYVYIWVSPSSSLVYVGQTNGNGGVIGRAHQHVKTEGTLRSRLHEHGYDLDEIDDFLLLSYPLPGGLKYSGPTTAGREAVEYFVQIGIMDAQIELNRSFEIVSNVRWGGFFDEDEAEQLAAAIVDDFKEVITFAEERMGFELAPDATS